jgi:hypothetical protein
MNTHTHRILAVAEGGLDFEPKGEYSLAAMLSEVHLWSLERNEERHVFTVDCQQYDKLSKSPGYQGLDRHVKGRFDQLWLFGRSAGDKGQSLLSQREIDGLDELMREGVLGIFATGDHDDVGARLCGNIPRVGGLRRWYRNSDPMLSPPAQNGPERADTIWPGFIEGGDKYDESDSTPKTIWSSNFILTSGKPSSATPHPLSFHPDFGRMSFLPDHMHEGACCIPVMGSDDKNVEYEFPGMNCQLVAWSVSWVSGGVPKMHPVIACYDHPKISRVVTDSTFHHWTWGNIKSIEAAPSFAWAHIRQYPRNIAAWLARAIQPRSMTREVTARLLSRSDIAAAFRNAERAQTRESFRSLEAALLGTIDAMQWNREAVLACLKADVWPEGSEEAMNASISGVDKIVTLPSPTSVLLSNAMEKQTLEIKGVPKNNGSTDVDMRLALGFVETARRLQASLRVPS